MRPPAGSSKVILPRQTMSLPRWRHCGVPTHILVLNPVHDGHSYLSVGDQRRRAIASHIILSISEVAPTRPRDQLVAGHVQGQLVPGRRRCNPFVIKMYPPPKRITRDGRNQERAEYSAPYSHSALQRWQLLFRRRESMHLAFQLLFLCMPRRKSARNCPTAVGEVLSSVVFSFYRSSSVLEA